jgi:hypothetical protein
MYKINLFNSSISLYSDPKDGPPIVFIFRKSQELFQKNLCNQNGGWSRKNLQWRDCKRMRTQNPEDAMLSCVPDLN